MSRADFIYAAYAAAVAAAKSGIPINPAIVAAQAALESDYGMSVLAKGANNPLSIKAGGMWPGPIRSRHVRDFDPDSQGWVQVIDDFRVYDTLRSCLADYGAILSRLPDYRDALQHHDSSGLFLRAVAQSDRHYAAKVWAIAQHFGLVPRDERLPWWPQKKRGGRSCSTV